MVDRSESSTAAVLDLDSLLDSLVDTVVVQAYAVLRLRAKLPLAQERCLRAKAEDIPRRLEEDEICDQDGSDNILREYFPRYLMEVVDEDHKGYYLERTSE